ncbi:MAG: glycosyltransferase [Prevotellaceae bacterium]|nr:glycosyltransferase [Prevotella sp.]MDD7248112.1 glycosyltransferase [Prevotellaceae bacterium]MDY2750117.1 glycosyltransferase [Prevotella sp.]
MTITASIVTYNHHLLDFEPVLRSLFASPVDVVYVIDHSDSMLELKAELQEFARRVLNGEPELKQKASNGFKLIYLPHENNGYGGGHNVALKDAMKLGSKYHLVVNPDVWFGPEVMPKLVRYMEEHEDVGQMMPKVLFPNGQIQRLAKMLPTPFDMFGRLCIPNFIIKRRNTIYELQQSGFTKILNVPYLSGCFMFLRMSAVQDVGLFDEQFFMYAEDIDMTRRIHKKYKTLYYPCTTIYHTFTRGSRKSLRLLRIHVVNIMLYFNKWGWFKDEERNTVNENVMQQIGGTVL